MDLMSPVRRLIYFPPFNYLVRNLVKPLGPVLPKRYRFPVSGEVTLDISPYGKLRVETNQTNAVTKDLFWRGIKGYEYPVVSIFTELIKDADVMLDCGANIGYFSLLAAKVNPSIKVYAFDPMPAALHFLERNISLNGLEDNIEVLPIAIGKSEGQAEFFVSKNHKALWLDHHIGGSSTMSRPRDEYSETITVDVDSIDRVVHAHSISSVDLIKMDTEATEDKVIEGAWAILSKYRPTVICEVIPGRIEGKIEKLMKELEYVSYFSGDDGLHKIDSLQGFTQIENIFFVHKDKQEILTPFLL